MRKILDLFYIKYVAYPNPAIAIKKSCTVLKLFAKTKEFIFESFEAQEH